MANQRPTVIDVAREALVVAEMLANEGHAIRALNITPEHGLPCVELEPSARLAALAEHGSAAFNSFGRDSKGPFRRGTFTRGMIRVVWTDRRA